MGAWAMLVRFAIHQGEKWRAIDNGSEEQNLTYAAEESIHTTSSAAGMSLARLFRSALGRRLSREWRLRGASKDMWKAYRQVPLADDQTRLCVIAVWDISMKKWRFCKAYALLFGLTGAVINFNRLPVFMAAAARRVLAVPVQHFFDDFRIVEPLLANGAGLKAFEWLADFIGLRFDPKKDQPPTPELPLLGNIEAYSRSSVADVVELWAKPERVEAVRLLVLELIARQWVTSGEASSLRGRLLHLASTRPSRTGRAVMPALNELASSLSSGAWSLELLWDLGAALELLRLSHVREFRSVPPLACGPRCWTDASFSVMEAGPAMKLCAILLRRWRREGGCYGNTRVVFRPVT